MSFEHQDALAALGERRGGSQSADTRTNYDGVESLFVRGHMSSVCRPWLARTSVALLPARARIGTGFSGVAAIQSRARQRCASRAATPIRVAHVDRGSP